MVTDGSDTSAALRQAIGDGSLRAWAREHGVSPATVSDLLNGRFYNVSVRTHNQVRTLLGLPPIPPRLPATVCPDCLERGIEVVHGDGLRCHGKNGVAVIVAEDERIVRRRGKWRPSSEWQRANAARKAAGLSWREAWDRLADVLEESNGRH